MPLSYRYHDPKTVLRDRENAIALKSHYALAPLDTGVARESLVPYGAAMRPYQVSTRIDQSQNDVEDCAKPDAGNWLETKRAQLGNWATKNNKGNARV